MTAPPETTPVAADPWNRFGWLMGAIWLVFLLFPIIGLSMSDEALLPKVLGVSGMLLFGAVYVHALVIVNDEDTWGAVTHRGWRHLLGMLLIMVALLPLLGIEILALTPYVVAMAMFTLPLRWAVGVALAMLACCVIAPWLDGTLRDVWFFSLIIALVSLATGLVRVLEERGGEARAAASELALANERDRVARDVHDVLGHSLTVVTVKAELAQRLIDVDPDAARHELDQIQALSRGALAEIRETVAGLRVANLADEVAAAQVALAGAGIRAQLPTDLSVVDPRHRLLMAWVLREAITNVVRHSGASCCTVHLGTDELRVTDDGCGTSGRKEGHGLRGIRERVLAAGGTLTLSPGPSGGTVLEVSL